VPAIAVLTEFSFSERLLTIPFKPLGVVLCGVVQGRTRWLPCAETHTPGKVAEPESYRTGKGSGVGHVMTAWK
jgi:hypothetical protein